MIKEQMAIKAIAVCFTQFEKMVEKLDKALETLKQVISNNNAEIRKRENKNKELFDKITETEILKANLNKMVKEKI